MNNLYLLFSRKFFSKTTRVVKTVVCLLFSVCIINATEAQLSLTNGAPSATIDFSASMPITVGSNPATAYAGTGFQPNPAFAGRLNSNAWASTGWSDPNLVYGGTQTGNDFGRGATAGAVSTGGIYAYTGLPGSVSNPALMFQPGGSDFTPGTFTLRIVNDGSSIINQINVSYNIFVRNDANRSQSFNFSYSTDDVNYTQVSALDYATPLTADVTPSWVVVPGSPSRVAALVGFSIAPTTFFYIRWSSDDISGSGIRDEIGLDDINITAIFPSPCTPPSVNATLNAFSSVTATQMNVNFTRGNGTGGVLVVASLGALSQNPISGIPYTANSNYGSGAALGNGFVVYRAAAAGPLAAGSFTMTGLSPGLTYTLTLFEYDITIPCYTTTGVSGTQTTLSGSATNASDQFRSKASGNWANANTWESFTGGFWVNSDLVPTAASASIIIQAGHVVDINSSASMDQTTVAGTLNLLNSGVINLANGPGIDMNILSTGVLNPKATTGNYTTAFLIAGGAQINVSTGGKIVVGDGGSTSGYSPLASTTNIVIWNNGSIFEWNSTDPFLTNSITYFPDAAPGVIPIFRVTRSPSLQPGAGTTTTWNGLMEVNANLTLKLGGFKIFRNGIIGTANLNQDDVCGQFMITGATAILGGTGAINLNTNGLDINSLSVTTLTSNKTINSNLGVGTLSLNSSSSLYCDAFVISGTCIFNQASGCTLRLGSPLGISASGLTGNIQCTGSRIFSTNSFYIYNGTSNQITGLGLPTIITTLTIANTGSSGSNTVTLSITNTSTLNFALTSGLFAAGSGQQLNIYPVGMVTATAGNFATGATAGILNFQGTGTITGNCSPYDVYASGAVDFGIGTVTIQNGGSFRINSGGSVNTNAPFYATGSSLVYNTGGVKTVDLEWTTLVSSGRGVPHHVTILASGTSVNFTGSGAIRYMLGNLTISSGTFFALSNVSGGDLLIAGNWTRAATGAFTNNARKVTFNSTAANQTVTVTGGGTEIFGYLRIELAVGYSLIMATATNITVNGNPASGIATNAFEFYSGDLDLNQNTFTFNSWVGNQNNIQVDALSPNFNRTVNSTGGQGVFAIYNNDPSNRTVLISRFSASSSRRALLIFSTNVKVTTGAVAGGFGGINFGINSTFYITTINGILQIDSRGFVDVNPPIYGANSFLIYNPGGLFKRNVEWGSGTTQPGYPFHVTIQNNTDLHLNTTANGNADRYLGGNLTISTGSSLSLTETTPTVFNSKLYVAANLALNGTLVMPTVIGGDIYVAGNWNRSATGVFTANDRAVFFNGSGASTITASGGQLFPYLYITMNSAPNSVSLLDDISISKEFSITTGVFNLQNKNTILKSDVNATASMGKFGASGSVSYGGTGRFIVERYIPTSLGADPNHLKSWQFLAVPVNGDNQTVNAAWQEGQAPMVVGTNGLGTIISNQTAGTGGFDVVGGVGGSMKTFDPATGSWVGISGTNITHYNKKGYMIFVRGDRNVSNSGAAPTLTTLRTKGKIMEPANLPPTTTIGSSQFESVGNPYASAIDFSNTAGVVKSANVQNIFYVWDPRLGTGLGYGAYQTFIKGGGPDYTVSPGGGSYPIAGSVHNIIESGQAFFVRAVAGGGTISFNENAKVSGSRLVTRPAPVTNRQLRNMLYLISGNDRILADGALNQFDKSYSDKVDIYDALKIKNTGENLGIYKAGSLLSVERSGIIKTRDTIFYRLGQLRVQDYQFEFTPENIGRQGMRAYLVDQYLNTQTAVSLTDTTRINFNVINVPGSYAADRFMLVFTPSAGPKLNPKLNIVLDGVIQENEIIVNWKTGEDNGTVAYEVERSADGKQYTKIHTEYAKGIDAYSWKDSDPMPGINYYRIRSLGSHHKSTYSNQLMLSAGKANNSIKVFPNPVTGNMLNLRLSGIQNGDYLMNLYNAAGKLILTKGFNFNGGTDNELVKLPAGLSNGLYQLVFIYPGGEKQSEQVLISH